MSQYIFSKTVNAITRVVYKAKEEMPINSNNRIAHVTYYKVGNVGDTVLSQCVRRTIQSNETGMGWKIISLKSSVSSNTIDTINKCKALVIGGGGLFISDTNENSRSGWQWPISLDQLNEISVPIIIYSVGYNYFRGQKGNTLFEDSIKHLVKKSSFVGLRNNGSILKIREIVGNEYSEKISFQPCTTTLIRKLYPGISPKTDTKRVAFNIAFDREELRFGDNQEAILIGIAKAAREIEKKGYTIVYVAHCKPDLKFLKYLDMVDCNYECADLSYAYPNRVYNFYNLIDVAIGMRGHAQMIPFGLNCEIITLCSHDKMRWFLQDINSEDWCIELTEGIESISERILNTFSVIHEINREDTRSRLLAEQKKLMDVTNMNNIEIRRIITDR